MAVLYWCIEKKKQKTHTDALWSWLLVSGLAGRGSKLAILCCPVARLSSPAQVGHQSKLSRFAVKCVIFALLAVTGVPARRGAAHRSLHADMLTFPTVKSDHRQESSLLGNRLVTHPNFEAFPGNLCRQQWIPPLGGSVAFRARLEPCSGTAVHEGIHARIGWVSICT